MFNKLLSLLFIMLTIMGLSSYSFADCAALTDKQLEAVHLPLKQLLTIVDDDAEDGRVPIIAQQAIEQLKKAVISLVDGRMACERSMQVATDSIEDDLVKAFTLNEQNEEQAIYGYDLQVFVQKSAIAPDLVIVHISFGIPCGSDNLLVAYRYRDNKWQKDLVWKSNPYKSIAGAYGDYYDYLVLPAKNNDAPKLVVIHGAPWCTSSWNPLSVDVVKLGDSYKPQKMLLHKQLVIYTGSDFSPELKRLTTGFELRAKVGMLDSDLLIRQGIYRYQLEGDKAIRVQPIAENVRDFVDEWLTLDTITARHLSNNAQVDKLIAIQTKLKERYGYYGRVNACKAEATYQVAMTFNGTQENDKEALYYFLIKSTRFGYLMQAISLEPNASCIDSKVMTK